MRERFAEPGVVSVRSQIGIVAEDPRVFRPYEVDEAISASSVIRRDLEIPSRVRSLLSVGLIVDMIPGHLSPDDEAIARRLRTRADLIEARRIRWESVDPVLRFEIVHRATALILARRGKAVYGV